MGKENTRAFVLKVGKREKENGKSANARYSRGPRGKTRGSRVIANKIIKKCIHKSDLIYVRGALLGMISDCSNSYRMNITTQ